MVTNVVVRFSRSQNVKLLTDDSRHTPHNEGQRSIAIGYLTRKHIKRQKVKSKQEDDTDN